MLDTPRYLHSSAKIEDERERVDVQKATQEDGNEGPNDVERVKVMLGEGEHGDADVGEDEVLSHEVEKIEKALGGLLALLGQVVECVMCLSYATEENLHGESALFNVYHIDQACIVTKINTYRNDACEAEDLGEKEG